MKFIFRDLFLTLLFKILLRKILFNLNFMKFISSHLNKKSKNKICYLLQVKARCLGASIGNPDAFAWRGFKNLIWELTMEVNWASIRNIQYFGEEKRSRKISTHALKEEISFLKYLNDALETGRSPSQKNRHKESLVDCEV